MEDRNSGFLLHLEQFGPQPSSKGCWRMDGSLLTVLWGGPVFTKGGHGGKFSMGILGSWPSLCCTASWLPCGEQVYSWLCSVLLPRCVYRLGPAPEEHGQSATERGTSGAGSRNKPSLAISGVHHRKGNLSAHWVCSLRGEEPQGGQSPRPPADSVNWIRWRSSLTENSSHGLPLHNHSRSPCLSL